MAAVSNGGTFGDGYEAHHWKNNLGLGIMDPTAGNGELLSIGNNDLRAFDAIGYDLTPVPEPSSCALLGFVGVAGFAWVSRRMRVVRSGKLEQF